MNHRRPSIGAWSVRGHAASEFREVHVMRTEIEVLPGKRTPYLAYAVESGGRTFLNPALIARRGDGLELAVSYREFGC